MITLSPGPSTGYPVTLSTGTKTMFSAFPVFRGDDDLNRGLGLELLQLRFELAPLFRRQQVRLVHHAPGERWQRGRLNKTEERERYEVHSNR